MEIKLKSNPSCESMQLNVVFQEKKIIALTGEGKEELIKILTLEQPFIGTIYVNQKRLLLKNYCRYQQQIKWIPLKQEFPLNLDTVEEYFRYQITTSHFSYQDENKKIKDALRLVGLKETIRMESLLQLSFTEKRLLQLAVALLYNPEILFVENPFLNLDYKNIKKVTRIFIKLKEKYGKTIFFTTDNCEEIYQYADDVVILKKGLILVSGEVENIYSQTSFLKKQGIPIPQTILFSNLVKEKKNIELDHHKDIRDLIKEIYRKV